MELLGHNILNIVHDDDKLILRENLIPPSHFLGHNGELLIPDGPDGKQKIGEALAREKRQFVIRYI